jgi:hypothetical protein
LHEDFVLTIVLADVVFILFIPFTHSAAPEEDKRNELAWKEGTERDTGDSDSNIEYISTNNKVITELPFETLYKSWQLK